MTNESNHIDFAEVECLFTVIEKAVAHSGKYANIMGLAAAKIAEIEAEAKSIRAEMEAERVKAEAAQKEAEAHDQIDNDEDGEVDEEDEGQPKAIPSSTFADKSRRV